MLPSLSLGSNITPRDYQIEAVCSIYDYFRANTVGNPVVVMPTGTGKSVVIAVFIWSVLQQAPTQRIQVITHVKELIGQNAAKMQQVWPRAPMGVYSAGLKRKEAGYPVTFGGIQTMKNAVHQFGWVDLVLVDECHLISPKQDTVYQEYLNELRRINPHLRVIGFTATDYRLGLGYITKGGVFTHNCINLSTVECWNRFIAEGYLVAPVPKRMLTELDISGIGLHNGEYALSQLQSRVDTADTNERIVRESIEAGMHRRSWLAFCSGVEHAEHLAERLRAYGISAAAVHSKLESGERDARIEAYKRGELRCVTNNNVLTTGFDDPKTDMIIMARPTISPGLWVQMLGRGTRPCIETQKRNCLVLDFAGNTPRLGPINDPLIPREKGAGTGEAPVKICEACGTYNHASARVCIACGNPFEIRSKLVSKPGSDELLRSTAPVVETVKVQRVTYSLHTSKKNEREWIKVSYFVDGLRLFQEWITFEGKGYAIHKAHDWWRARFDEHYHPIPIDNKAAIATLVRQGGRVPHAIRVWTNKDLPEVMSHEFI